MPADEQIHRELGGLTADVAALKIAVAELGVLARSTHDAVVENRGKWKGFAALASLVGGGAGYVVSALKIKFGGP